MEKGHGRDLPFSPGGAAYLPESGARTARRLPQGSQPGDNDRDDRYYLLEVYEFFTAEYGSGSPAEIEARFTDEQFALYIQKAAKRKASEAFAALDRVVIGTSWGMAIAHDTKKRAARRWESIRRKTLRGTQRKRGLTGAALEAAVMGLAASDSSLVKIEQAGA